MTDQNLLAKPLRTRAANRDMRRSRLVVVCLVALLALAGWAYLMAMVAAMVPVMDMAAAGPGMGLLNSFNLFADLPAEARAALAILCLPGQVATFGMPDGAGLAGDAGLVFVMWMMMTLAMMLPSALPVFLAHADRWPARHPAVTTASLALGYLAVWAGYAVVATAAQMILAAFGLLSAMMAPVSLVLAGTTLIVAGLYQFTPAKLSCLTRCWVPRWQSTGPDGSPRSLVREGMVQGLACFGCCWAMMTVMFAVGIMNIVWVAVLGILMAVEKNVPSLWLYKLIGIFFIGWGGLLLAIATGVLV